MFRTQGNSMYVEQAKLLLNTNVFNDDVYQKANELMYNDTFNSVQKLDAYDSNIPQILIDQTTEQIKQDKKKYDDLIRQSEMVSVNIRSCQKHLNRMYARTKPWMNKPYSYEMAKIASNAGHQAFMDYVILHPEVGNNQTEIYLAFHGNEFLGRYKTYEECYQSLQTLSCDPQYIKVVNIQTDSPNCSIMFQ